MTEKDYDELVNAIIENSSTSSRITCANWVDDHNVMPPEEDWSFATSALLDVAERAFNFGLEASESNPFAWYAEDADGEKLHCGNKVCEGNRTVIGFVLSMGGNTPRVILEGDEVVSHNPEALHKKPVETQGLIESEADMPYRDYCVKYELDEVSESAKIHNLLKRQKEHLRDIWEGCGIV